ncbi:ABC transporter permease [Kineosporia babensis]
MILGCLGWIVFLVGWSLSGLFPHSPTVADPGVLLHAPGGGYLFGVDQDGYDVLSRTVYAAKFDVLMALSGALVAAVTGTWLGILMSSEGRLSALATRGLDVFQAVPLLVVAVAVIGLVGTSRTILVVIIAAINTPLFIRLVQAEARLVRKRGYVAVARVYGVSERTIRWRHILPNVTGVLFPQFSLSVGYAIASVGALSFLGLSEPGSASWGSMIKAGIPLLPLNQWWMVVFPSLALFTVVLAFSELSHRLQGHVEQIRGGSR